MISGYVDDELLQGERQQVDVHLRSCQKCKSVFDDMVKLRKAVSDSATKLELSQSEWEKIMNDMPSKASAGIGWILLIAGTLTLTGFLVWEFAISDEPPLYVKLAVSSIIFGFVSLFGSVLRQRLIARKTDPYKDVQI
jgi:hypothetical protein